MKQIRIIVSGFVQGVGYRAWVKRKAQSLGLAGWVKNREDTCVEICAEGETERLEKLVELCRSGPEVSFVEDVEVIWSDATLKFKEFEVVY